MIEYIIVTTITEYDNKKVAINMNKGNAIPYGDDKGCAVHASVKETENVRKN
jgi:hypothetical protein